VIVDGYQVNALLDTGSDYCVISLGLCHRMRKEVVREGRVFNQLMSEATSIGYVILKLKIGLITCMRKCYVLNLAQDLLIIDSMSMIQFSLEIRRFLEVRQIVTELGVSLKVSVDQD